MGIVEALHQKGALVHPLLELNLFGRELLAVDGTLTRR
jgi:hypothetical protein